MDGLLISEFQAYGRWIGPESFVSGQENQRTSAHAIKGLRHDVQVGILGRVMFPNEDTLRACQRAYCKLGEPPPPKPDREIRRATKTKAVSPVTSANPITEAVDWWDLFSSQALATS